MSTKSQSHRRSASPHTRGWTRASRPSWRGGPGFPAHAGMDPASPSGMFRPQWLPRTRGDGPAKTERIAHNRAASPHTRGWTHFEAWDAAMQAGFPAHAGMDPLRRRGESSGPTASPHTRGWTRVCRVPAQARPGFPAHAGMDPLARLPRWSGFRLPRTRGDGPPPDDRGWQCSRASPHTRGWTSGRDAVTRRLPGFPAHAGMDLWQRRRSPQGPGLPRTRVDGPRMDPCHPPSVT